MEMESLFLKLYLGNLNWHFLKGSNTTLQLWRLDPARAGSQQRDSLGGWGKSQVHPIKIHPPLWRESWHGLISEGNYPLLGSCILNSRAQKNNSEETHVAFPIYQRFAKHFENVTNFALSKSVLQNIMQIVQLTSVRLPMSNDSLEE